MKRAFVSLLIMTLTLTSISLVNIASVQAVTVDNTVTTENAETTADDKLVVSLGNIREIVIENNLDLKILDNKVKIAKENRDAAKESFYSKSKLRKSDYNDADGNYDSSKYEEAVRAYKDLEDKYKSAKEAYKTAKTNYDQKVETAVNNAQSAYITYLNDLSTSKINQDTVNYNNKKAEISKIQYENGFISKNQYIKNLQGNTSTNDLNKSKDTEELDRVKLCNLLGISPEEKVIFNTDITVDFQVIAKINYEKDLQEMLDNSLDIKTKSDNGDNLKDEDIDTDVHDYEIDNAEIELKQAKNSAETDFKETYNDLMASYNSLKSSYDKIIQEQNEFEITQTQYDYGYISKNALDNAQITLDKDNASFIKTRNECYLKYLKYIEMKEGY